MAKTAIIVTPKYLEHNPGFAHPESPERLKSIMAELERSGLLETGRCELIEPRPASTEELQLVHDREYVELVKRYCMLGGGAIDMGDTVVSRESYDVASLAVGGALKAVELVVNGRFKNAFAFVRPPGHHAGSYYAMGFCIFNNVAIAALHLLRRYGLSRIAILDVDAHHGNGTQETFYDTNKVLYISLHQDPRMFPGTGFIEETGEGEGLGYTVNVPLPFRTGDETYLKAFKEIAIPIAHQYKPQFILVSAGFDCHYTDPVASLSLSSFAYSEVFADILDMASKLCEGKTVAVLEGGYNIHTLGKLTTLAAAKMAGLSYDIRNKRTSTGAKARIKAEQTLKDLKSLQSSFWNV